MTRRALCLLAVFAALATLPAAAGAAVHWRPVGMAKAVVKANLKHLAPGFTPSIGSGSCAGKATVANCTVHASFSNDNVTARLRFTRHRDGSHIRYEDKLSVTAVMGGGTVTRIYYGKVLT